jgi:hypothetical protein
MAACEDIKLPKLLQHDINAEFFLTPPIVVKPKELFTTINTSYANGQDFVIPVNPNGLSLSGVKRDDGTYVIKLRGTIESGIPEALKLFSHQNLQYLDATQTDAEAPYYRYGDYYVNTYPKKAYTLPVSQLITDPNLSPRDIDLTETSNPLIAGRSTRYAAITLKGMLEVKDKKGNVRDLSHGIEIEQRNEAFNLYSNSSLTGGNDVWSYNINRYAEPPIMSARYNRISPEDFPERDTFSNKYIHRGGISFLIWEGAASKVVYFTVKYLDGGTTRVEVDYSQVIFVDVQPIVFWFYSDYSARLAANPSKNLPVYLTDSLASPEKNGSTLKDPDGSLVTERKFTAPLYDPPTDDAYGASYGPYPFLIAPREKLQRAKAGLNTAGSALYDNASDKLTISNRSITLLPVFYPAHTTNKKITWQVNRGSVTEGSYTEAYNTDGSLTITRSSEVGVSGTLAVTATVYVPNETDPNRVAMKLNAEIHIDP